MIKMSEEQTGAILGTAVTAARTAGDFILKHLGQLTSADIHVKQTFDFVTRADLQSESIILEAIGRKFPTHSFLTEESETAETPREFRWIIDPLDGTTNYIHGFPVFAVSIALEHKGDIVIGVVFDPLRDELFHAVKGQGSYLNNKRINVSAVSSIQSSLVSTGFPFRKKEMTDSYLRVFSEVFHEVSDLRRAGSAALDLAYVASGRCDGFFELNLSPWDIAAGSLLIGEAGGCISDFRGENSYMKSGNVVAGNQFVHSQLVKIINKTHMVF